MTVKNLIIARRAGTPGLTPTTWNPSDKNTHVSLSGGNLVATSDNLQTDQYAAVRSVAGKSSGKWYWEYTILAIGASTDLLVGATISTDVLVSNTTPASFAASSLYASANGLAYSGGVNFGGTVYIAGDVIQVKLDMDAKTLVVGKNGTYYATMKSSLTGTQHAICAVYNNNFPSVRANFGGSAFVYAVPSGYTGGLG